MNKKILLLMVFTLLANPMMAQAEEESSGTETTTTKESTATDYVSRVKEKYQLTDQQVQALKDSKIAESQYSMVGALSKESGKTVEEILKMRTEQKMGWGKIAKELGVKPSVLGQSVSSMHRKDDNSERKVRKEEREARREEKRQARNEAHSQRKEK